MLTSFEKLDVSDLKDKKVILDIDGTIAYDKEDIVSDQVLLKIKELNSLAKVFLCSNGSLERSKNLGKKLGLDVLSSSANKPSLKVLAKGVFFNKEEMVFIGDKFITDGLLAASVGARFLEVLPLRKDGERFSVRLSYLVNSISSFFIKPFSLFIPASLIVRPWQWVKNLLIFTPIFFAGSINNLGMLIYSGHAFLVFCAVASLMYIFNDFYDIENDRNHPIKRFRPLAWKTISVPGLVILITTLIFIAVYSIYNIPQIIPIILVYLLLNILYSKYLKNLAVVDIVTVALFYVIRIEVGGIAAKVTVSPWIILCVFFGALFLAAGKRNAEYQHQSKRSVLTQYSQEVIKFIVLSSAVLSVSTYSLYSVLGSKSPYQIYTVPIVFAVIFRLLSIILSKPEEGEFPESLIFRDKNTVFLTIFWILFSFVLIY